MYIELTKLNSLMELRKKKIEEIEQWFNEQINGINITRETFDRLESEKESKFEQICESTKVGYYHLRSSSRNKEIVTYRHILCYLGRKRLGMTTVMIGDKLRRDHSTVISSINRVSDWVKFAEQHEGEMLIYREIDAIFDRFMSLKSINKEAINII